VAQAALAAMHRSIGFEFPDQAFGHLDLPHRDVDAATAHAIIEVLLAEGSDMTSRRLLAAQRNLGRLREQNLD
uniref:hypothetical protein n=1 Tax=Mycobacterium avium TaxID=1764 RepID=UPI00111C430C